MWSQLIWLDPANWSGTPLGSPVDEVDSPSAAAAAGGGGVGNVETLSSHSSDREDEDDEEEDEEMDSAERDEYGFLDEINEEVDNDINHTAAMAHTAEADEDSHLLEGLEDGSSSGNSNGNKVEGSWDLISYLPAAASVYLRHTIGTPPPYLHLAPLF
jgi:hypothetical protein